MTPIQIPGCRHDVLGHNLKAIGLLRALATCSEPKHRDVEAEGWWDLGNACFCVRSDKYPSKESLAKFFAQHYRPTPIFSPWNTGGGLDEKQEVIFKIDPQPRDDFLRAHDATLRAHGYVPGNNRGEHSWKDGKLTFDLKNGEFQLEPPEGIEFRVEHAGGKRSKPKAVIQWAGSVLKDFSRFLRDNLAQIEKAASVPKATKEKLEQRRFSQEELCLTVKSLEEIDALKLPAGIVRELRTKTSGEKSIIAVLQEQMVSDPDVIKAIEAGRRRFSEFRAADSAEQRRDIFESFRDELPDLGALAMDAILTSRTGRISDNPLFLDRGKSGNSEIFRSFWSYFLAFREKAPELIQASLFPHPASLWDKEKSPGSPFFPDAVKTYNNGLGWVVETFPFNALDYLLAVEGAIAMRGAVSRTLAANSRRFAAFPFVFDSGEDLVDDSNEVKGTAFSIWLPLWDRSATFAELTSFICDAQARLPGKEARFSAEFARALRVQGVDAGFVGWQEFRFKMKASRVPWVCTGRYLGSVHDRHSIALNDALASLDESGFLDQFEPWFEGNKIGSHSPHPVRAALNLAIEQAVAEPTPENALDILIRIYTACRQIALSESFRKKLRGRATFFQALPQEPWENLLQGLEHSPEFRIARALASITGFAKQWGQSNGKAVFSEVQPLLGSLLPLKRGPREWYLPTESKDRSNQAVWSGTDLCHDLALVLSRRYLDSRDDDRPAVMAVRAAPLEDVLAFINGDLDDHRIARWIEALSLIGWRWEREENDADATLSNEERPLEEGREKFDPIPLAYAALRSLLEVECEWQGNDPSAWKKRRSQRPVAVLCQRTPSSLVLAVEDALRWLSIWSVPNFWSEDARREKPRLAGQDIVGLDHRELNFSEPNNRIVNRLAAAVLIPLDWWERGKLYRAVTLPQTIKY